MTNQLLAELEALQKAKDKLQNDYQEARDRIDEFKFTIRIQQQQIDELINRIDKAKNNIDILQEIIYQQPTKEDNMWLLDRLDGIKNILGDKENE